MAVPTGILITALIVMSMFCLVLSSIAVESFDKNPSMKIDYRSKYEFSSTAVSAGIAGLLLGGYAAYAQLNP